MLLGNGVRLANSNPMRIYGAPQAGTIERSNWLQNGASRSGLTGYDVQTCDDASRKSVAAVPSGYGPGVAWVMPVTAGSMSTRGQISAVATVQAAAAMGVNIEASISASALLDAVGQLVVSAQATIAGTSSMTGNVLAALQMSADLAASGNVVGTLTGIGSALASLSGGASVTATLTGTGALQAVIEVGGVDGALTAPQIASELLDVQLVETGLSVRETLRLCVAALAGKVSGASGTTITIRNAVEDSKDRIVATVDANGNRTAITYDLE